MPRFPVAQDMHEFEIGREYIVQFTTGRDNMIMTRINGKVAFPDRLRWGDHFPIDGEVWKVKISGRSRNGSAIFLRGVCNITAEQKAAEVRAQEERQAQEERLRRRLLALEEAEQHARDKLDVNAVREALMRGVAPCVEVETEQEGWFYCMPVFVKIGNTSAVWPAAYCMGGWERLLDLRQPGKLKLTTEWHWVWPELAEDVAQLREFIQRQQGRYSQSDFVEETWEGKVITARCVFVEGRGVITEATTKEGIPFSVDKSELAYLQIEPSILSYEAWER